MRTSVFRRSSANSRLGCRSRLMSLKISERKRERRKSAGVRQARSLERRKKLARKAQKEKTKTSRL